MLVMETEMKIRGWILRDGSGIRAVARQTGVSRTTVKKYLEDAEPSQYRRTHERVGHKLSAAFGARLRKLVEHDL